MLDRIARLVSVAVIAALMTPLATAQPAKPWRVPRTADGHPDLQGNWTNATLTPLTRPTGQERALTKEQVIRVEKIRADTIDRLSQASDPNRPAPPKGGDGSVGAAGMVGGYNYFYIDAGDHAMVVNGEHRSSIVVDPADGRIPPLTQEARDRMAANGKRMSGFGQYDNPENRPLAERCMLSFGSNAGPPMLPNYFYNNNYTIVQTANDVMIMTEMVHDARIVRLRPGPALPEQVRLWFGDSRGRWVGDTLVIETGNFHPDQTFGASGERRRVTERLHRVDQRTILYRFTIDDPSTFTKPWSGELPFLTMDDLIYEYACHEGNYALANVLSGARAAEREAAPAKPDQ